MSWSFAPAPGEGILNPGQNMSDQPAQFVTTHWSQVIAAGACDSSHARASLEQLCRNYWYPLYAFARRSGKTPEDSQDLTQEFFARLLEKNFLATADREKGRFRTFLISAFKHFLAKEWRKERTLKRGGDQIFVPIDGGDAESRYGFEPADQATPERIFERRWAMTVLEQTLAIMRAEYEDSGKGAIFNHLKGIITAGKTDLPYAKLADELKLSEGAVKVAAHRMRRRYRETLRRRIADTVRSEAEVDEELRNLLAALST
jgi:RNA polymerase sigma factor (sigma-70 family)